MMNILNTINGFTRFRARYLFVAVFVAGCVGVFLYNQDPYDLRRPKQPEEKTIPERPASKFTAIEVISGDLNRGDLIPVRIEYYTAPLPEHFDKEFLSLLDKGTVIEVHGYEYKEGLLNWHVRKNVTGRVVRHSDTIKSNPGVVVFIGNSPAWREQIRIINSR